MTTLENHHDKLFKLALASPQDAAKVLRAVLPRTLGEYIDWRSLAAIPGSFVDERMRGAQADLLYSARYKENEALVYILMEHKSEVDPWTPLQLLRYMLRIWEQRLAKKPATKTLPPIIPLIVHHSESGWSAPTHFHGLFDPILLSDEDLKQFTPEFFIRVDDISHASDNELRARSMGPEATLGFLFLRDGRREGRILDELSNWADLFRAVLQTPNGRRAILQLFSYLSRVTPNLGPKELAERVHQAIPETEDVVMTLAEQLIEQGRMEGLLQGQKEGLLQGQKEGLRRTLRRLLELKFGKLSDDAERCIDSATVPALERYTERVLTASTLEEVLSD